MASSKQEIPEHVRRVLEMRRSSIASRHGKRPTRADQKTAAMRQQDHQ